MARNRGKRPGVASGSSSPSRSQARDTDMKAGDSPADSSQSSGGAGASKTPGAASSSIAAKVEAATAGTAKTSGEASKTSSSTASTATTPATTTASQASRAQTGSSATKSQSATGGSATTSGGAASSGGGGRNNTKSSSGGGSGGFWPGLIGGVIGGAATALAASLFWMDGDSSATTALESRLAAAEQQVSQIGALDDRVAAVEAAPAGNGDMTQRLDDLETRLAALGGAPSGDGTGDGAGDALGERLTSLEQQFETLSGVEQEIQALAGEVQSAGETQATNVQALTNLGTALPTLEETLAATGLSVGQVSEQTAALSQSVETLSSRVGEAESRLDHLGGEYQRGAAMIVAIGDINRAVTKDEPFEGPLQTLTSLVRDEKVLAETLTMLEPMAVDGVPTLKALKSEYGQMASRVLLAEEGDPSITDQVSNNVFGIFNIRPAGGDVEGSGSRAILARAQSKVSADDIDGAILELAGLEGRGVDEAAPWIERAGARLAAEASLVELRSHAQELVAQGS